MICKRSISFYVDKLSNLQANLNSMDEAIDTFLLANDRMDDDQFAESYGICERYDDNINRCIAALKNELKIIETHNSNVETIVSSANNGDNSNSSSSKIRIPELELPLFDGRPEKYHSFISSLELILSKFKLTEFEKYAYLKQQVSGHAKQIVAILETEITENTYEDAKKLLEEAFSNPTVQKFSVIDSLVNLKLNSNNVYSWISETRQIVQQIGKLNITPDIFAQYFIWQNMPEKFKALFIAVTNNSKPSLQQIIDSSFEVVGRLQSSVKEPNAAISLATRVNYNSEEKILTYGSQCWLCTTLDGHRIFQCKKYPDPENKLKRIHEMAGCSRCGLPDHTEDSCSFRFTGRCKKCNDFHANFLCNQDKANESRPPSKEYVNRGRNFASKRGSGRRETGSSNNISLKLEL